MYELIDKNTSLFSVVNNASVSASSLNNDLVKIEDWNWNIGICRLTRILLNKQKKFFLKKKKEKNNSLNSSFLIFNNSLTEQATTQKHLGSTLDQKLTFEYHVNKKIKKP